MSIILPENRHDGDLNDLGALFISELGGATEHASRDIMLSYSLGHLSELDAKEDKSRRISYEQEARRFLVESDTVRYLLATECDFEERFGFKLEESPLVDIGFSEIDEKTVLIFKTEPTKDSGNYVYRPININFIPEKSIVIYSNDSWSEQEADPYREWLKELLIRGATASKIKAQLNKLIGYHRRGEKGWMTSDEAKDSEGQLMELLSKHDKALWLVELDASTEKDRKKMYELTKSPYRVLSHDELGKIVPIFMLRGLISNEPNEHATLLAESVDPEEKAYALGLSIGALPRGVDVVPVFPTEYRIKRQQ